MESTRIYKILSQLSIPQLNRFIKFIKSPYHNVNERIEALAVLIVNSLRNKEELSSKELIWKVVDRKKSYSDLKFRKLCNDLLERFEKFLIIENLESNKLQQANLLLDSIRKNKFEILAEKHISKSSKELDRGIDQSSDYYLQKYYYEKTIQNLKTNFEKKINANSYPNLIKNLDAFYLIEKLRIEINIQASKKKYKSQEEIDMGFPVKAYDKISFANHPAVDVYRSMLKLFDDNEMIDDYYVLKDTAFNNIYSFPKDEQKDIFDVLVSYCVKWVNRGNMDFHRETLRIYDWGIEQGINLNKGKLSPTSFRNYVVIGLRVGEFDKVENFIKNNLELLNEGRKENALNFNLARVEFYRKNFEEVLFYLNKVNYDDIWYNLNSKMLLLAAYYELDEIEVLESAVDAFILFCRRDKILDAQKKTQYFNFAKSVKKLTKLNSNKKLITLKEKIKSTRVIGNKQWLLEKIDELITKK